MLDCCEEVCSGGEYIYHDEGVYAEFIFNPPLPTKDFFAEICLHLRQGGEIQVYFGDIDEAQADYFAQSLLMIAPTAIHLMTLSVDDGQRMAVYYGTVSHEH